MKDNLVFESSLAVGSTIKIKTPARYRINADDEREEARRRGMQYRVDEDEKYRIVTTYRGKDPWLDEVE